MGRWCRRIFFLVEIALVAILKCVCAVDEVEIIAVWRMVEAFDNISIRAIRKVVIGCKAVLRGQVNY